MIYDTSNDCESLKTSESKEISLFLRLLYLGNISLQIEKEIQQYLIKNLPTKFRFRLVYTTLTILANASNLKIVKPYCTVQEVCINQIAHVDNHTLAKLTVI